jgi:hypothetical protein
MDTVIVADLVDDVADRDTHAHRMVRRRTVEEQVEASWFHDRDADPCARCAYRC